MKLKQYLSLLLIMGLTVVGCGKSDDDDLLAGGGSSTGSSCLRGHHGNRLNCWQGEP